MHLFALSVFERKDPTARSTRKQDEGGRTIKHLRALAAFMLALTTGVPSGFAQQPAGRDKAASDLPAAPAPILTEPLNLRQTARDFSQPSGRLLNNPFKAYLPTTVAKANFVNSVRFNDLVKDGKIYLSLSDAIALAIENNYDIAISRYNLDIADTDLLRARAGSVLRGVNTAIVTGTQGGSTSTLATGGGPGGTSGGSGGAGSGSSGLVLTTNGVGPIPAALDPALAGTIQLERSSTPEISIFQPAASTNTNQYNFTYSQGFIPGTTLAVAWNNSRVTTTSFNAYSPEFNTSFRATVTQPLLQGAGIWVNRRFVYQALNDRRITDSAFRQQLLYTVNQVETIYWGLVSAYEDVQAKERALAQSTKLDQDNRKQLAVGTLAPLDVVNSDSAVAADKQALISAQNSLNYQQQIIKQAIARNLNDPALEVAAVIPTDRVNLDVLPEESEPVEQLVKEAFSRRPELEQAYLQIKNNEITLHGARNALLPTLNIYGFYSANGVGGSPNTNCHFGSTSCAATTTTGYSDVLNDLVNSSAPDKGVGFTLQIPIRNRTAQADQARSLLEYRQSELRIEQLYTQIRMQVVNAQFAIANDRAQVRAAIAAQDYAQQSLDAEIKKLHLGASTTANVLLQERNLATASDNLIAANAAYAKDRAGLYQVLANTLQHYNINLDDAAAGVVNSAPVVPGLTPAKPGNEPTTTPPNGQ